MALCWTTTKVAAAVVTTNEVVRILMKLFGRRDGSEEGFSSGTVASREVPKTFLFKGQMNLLAKVDKCSSLSHSLSYVESIIN